MNGEIVAVLEGKDPSSKKLVCVDATRAYTSPGRLILSNREPGNGNVLAVAAVVNKKLRIGFLATKKIRTNERVICIEVCIIT